MKKKPTYEELEKRVRELEQTKYDHELMGEKLRESEECFRTVIEQSPSAIEIYEPNGKLLIVNDAWESFWNMKKSDMVDFNIFNDPECERTGLTSAFKKVLQDSECSIPPSKYDPKESGFPGGSIRWINSKMYPIKDLHGKIKNIVLVLEDITAQKNAEEVLKKSHNELELKIKERIAERVKAVDALKEQKKFSEKIIETSNAIIVGLNENHKIMLFNQGAEKLTGFSSGEVIGRDWFKIFFKPDIYDEMDRVWESAWGAKYNSYVNPIQTKNGDEKIISWQTTGMYDHGDETKHMALSIGEDITERMQAEDALRESETKYRLLAESMSDVIVQLSPAGELLYVSPNVKEFGGYDPESEIGNDMSKYFANDTDIIQAVKLLEKISETHQTGSFEFLFKPKDKKPFYVEHTYFPIVKDNKATAIQLVLRDITERKKSEAAIQKASREWTLAMDAFDDIIYLLDNDRCVVQANSAFYNSMGITPEEAIGRHIVEIVHPQGENKPCPVCLAQEEKRDFVMIMEADVPNNPAERPIEITVKIVRNEDGTPSGILMNLHDLTTVRAGDEALRQYEHIISATNDHMSFLDRDYTYLAVNDAYLTAHKKERSQIIGHTVADILGDDIFEQFVKEKLVRCLAGEEIHYQDWFDFSGLGQRYMDVTYYPYAGSDGIISGVVVSSHDITERKLSEMAVKRREQYLEALNKASQLLLIPTDSPPFQEIVDLIGPVSQASRAYIFINNHSSDGELLTSQKAEWCAKGITPEINNPDLQNMSYDALVPRLKETLQQGDIYKGRVADFPENEREILEPQGILSILIIPMILDNEFIGFIGFDNCVSEYEWDSVDQTFLGTAAAGVGQAIKRMHTENSIRNSLDEKGVLLREIHHRVKNNMQVIISLLRMHGRRTDDANLSKVFEDCRDRINAMSLIHESLYQSDNLAKIDFKDYIKKLCRNLGQAYGVSGKGISLAVGECDVALDMDQGIAIGMVIAELISNAFKHAFPTGKGGNVSINLSELDAENVKLIIKDDGKGMPPEIDIMNSPSLGLRLAVSAVTLELGGSIEIERDKGTQFTICFKYKRK